jgi:signal transduction histidine kinase
MMRPSMMRPSLRKMLQDQALRGWESFLRTDSFVLRFVGVHVISAAGILAAFVLHQSEKDYYTAIPAFAAVMLSLWGGFWLGLIFTIALGLVIDLLFVPPSGMILASAGAQGWFVVNTILAGTVGLLVSSLRFSFHRLDMFRQDAERAKQEAEEAVHARDEIVGVISHELKNPLSALQTGVDLIQRVFPQEPGNEFSRQLVNRLVPSIKRMSFLVSDLLDVTRIEANALELDVGKCDLAALVLEVITSYETLAQEKGIRLSRDIPTEAQYVVCDSARTLQVLSNLVSNAVKFTKVGGSVKISARRTERYVEVDVADTGSGMPPEVLPHVFDRFWQAKDTAYRGTGLGLAIAKGLVLAQNGQIWVRSKMGAGSSFYFTLRAAS